MDLEDPELSGANSLLVLVRELQRKWTWRILSSQEQIPYWFDKALQRTLRPEDLELSGVIS